MKYSLSIEIEAPRGPVVALFREAENWPRWQEPLLRWESVRGRPDETGALTKLVHRFGGRDVEMLETVVSSRLPDELIGTYEAPSAWNRVTYGFGDAGPQKTLWRFDSEFRCRGTHYADVDNFGARRWPVYSSPRRERQLKNGDAVPTINEVSEGFFEKKSHSKFHRGVCSPLLCRRRSRTGCLGRGGRGLAHVPP